LDHLLLGVARSERLLSRVSDPAGGVTHPESVPKGSVAALES
jgi:hypothetical protein